MTLNPLLPIMYEPIVRTALLEDLGRAGDITADAIVNADQQSRLVLRARQPGVVAGLDIARCASGGIMRSSVVTRYQLGFVFHAGWLMTPPSASRPHGTCESAMNAAVSASTSPANEAANFALSSSR